MSFRRWLYIAVFAALALFGLFGAADATTAAGQNLGIGLAIASVLAALTVIKQYFDGVPDTRVIIPMPTQPRNAVRLLVVMGILALGGVFVASLGDPYLYTAGLTLALVAIILGFKAISAYFDASTKTTETSEGGTRQEIGRRE